MHAKKENVFNNKISFNLHSLWVTQDKHNLTHASQTTQ